MKTATVVILLLSIALSVCGQDFNTHWIYAPQADSTSHVWFRRAFLSEGTPEQATITVATTGYYKLYVNECNVGTALYYPLRHNNDSTPVSITFDATPYLRPDTNVVALIYSPTRPSESHRQISVNIFGTDYQGKSFSHVSDNSWICRRANSCMTTDGGEIIDGTKHNPSWKAATIYDQGLWINAETSYKSRSNGTMEFYDHGCPTLKATKVTSLSYLHASQNPLCLYLADSFRGFPMVTLREAKRGENLQIGNVSYICSGDIDEQAYPVFSISNWSTLFISGDNRFKPSQVTGIDLVETGEGWFPNF